MAYKVEANTSVDNQPTNMPVGSTGQVRAAVKVARAERSPRKARVMQPLDTLSVPGARLRIGTVEVLVGLKRSAIYKHIKTGKFPAPLKSGARCSRWNSDDIRAYLAGSAQ